MKTGLKTVHKNMFARDLKGVIDLPDYDDNQLVKVTVYPTEEEKKLTPEEFTAILEKITGAIPYTDKTLDELRIERLEKKYGLKLAD